MLLILAGISISMLTGQNGILKKAIAAKELTEIGEAEDRANLIYMELKTEDENNYIKEITLEEITSELEKQGYEIKIVGKNHYYIVISGESYQITLKPDGVRIAEKATDTEEEITFPTDFGTIDVIWLSGTSNTVTSTPNAPILSQNGDEMTPVSWSYDETAETWSEDTTTKANWYSYQSGDGRTDTKKSEWANAKTANGSYFVWIPRYAYRITYYSSSTNTTPTGYYDGYGMWDAITGKVKQELDSGVEIVNYNGEKYIVHPAFQDNLDLGGWSNKQEGFWFAKYEMSKDSNLSLSTTNATDALKSVPNVASLRDKTIGDQYLYARNANFGYTGTQETITSGGIDYTHTSYMNSHMVKNSEWGAVAYLTQSQYGRNGNEIDINNSSDYITGNGGGSISASKASGTTNAYDTKLGAQASTTGNVYGIYDMSGGAWEYVASYDKLGNSSYVAGSSSGLNLTQEAKSNTADEEENYSYISTKYATAYSIGTSSYSGNNIVYGNGRTGDATKEVRTGGIDSLTSTNSYSGWFSDYSNFVTASNPFFIRGGSYNGGSGAGVFCSSYHYGINVSGCSFRVVLCP